MGKWRDNISFVLVEPKEAGNVGASARSMKNMGFSNLCLVNPPDISSGEGRWFARNAHDILDSARIYSDLNEAIDDKQIVVGTTRRKGKRRGVILSIEEGAERIFHLAAKNKVAILFGREARGLFNDEVEECGFMMTIPASPLQPSLNLSHAVLLAAYELSKAECILDPKMREDCGRVEYVQPPDSGQVKDKLAPHETLTALYERISPLLEMLDYVPKGDRNLNRKVMQNLKHFIGRAGLTEWELNMLHGICWQIEKKLKPK